MTILDPPVRDVLSRVVELGYVSLHKGTIVDWVPPRYNLWLSRLSPTLTYLSEYGRRHRDLDGEFFLCLYDGWREYSQPIISDHRQYVPWAKLDPVDFLGIGSAREPRFRHRHPDPTIYPELPRQVLTYNRHCGDRNALRSNSLVLKVSTHWEQWYYSQLIADRHYVPVEKYEDLSELILSSEANVDACQRIVTEAHNIVSKLTRDYAVTEYAIH
jgi:hypothetical protein